MSKLDLTTGKVLQHYTGEKYTVIGIGTYMMTGEDTVILQSNRTFEFKVLKVTDVFETIIKPVEYIVSGGRILAKRFKVAV